MRQFSPGFRLSAVDVIVLIVATIAVIALSFTQLWLSGVIAFVVAHFFLFCNVFRLARPLELFWAGVFILLAAGTLLFALPGWWITYAISLAVTVAVVAIEMRKPSYHGVFWQRINPTLRDWWEMQTR